MSSTISNPGPCKIIFAGLPLATAASTSTQDSPKQQTYTHAPCDRFISPYQEQGYLDSQGRINPDALRNYYIPIVISDRLSNILKIWIECWVKNGKFLSLKELAIYQGHCARTEGCHAFQLLLVGDSVIHLQGAAGCLQALAQLPNVPAPTDLPESVQVALLKPSNCLNFQSRFSVAKNEQALQIISCNLANYIGDAALNEVKNGAHGTVKFQVIDSSNQQYQINWTCLTNPKYSDAFRSFDLVLDFTPILNYQSNLPFLTTQSNHPSAGWQQLFDLVGEQVTCPPIEEQTIKFWPKLAIKMLFGCMVPEIGAKGKALENFLNLTLNHGIESVAFHIKEELNELLQNSPAYGVAFLFNLKAELSQIKYTHLSKTFFEEVKKQIPSLAQSTNLILGRRDDCLYAFQSLLDLSNEDFAFAQLYLQFAPVWHLLFSSSNESDPYTLVAHLRRDNGQPTWRLRYGGTTSRPISLWQVSQWGEMKEQIKEFIEHIEKRPDLNTQLEELFFHLIPQLDPSSVDLDLLKSHLSLLSINYFELRTSAFQLIQSKASSLQLLGQTLYYIIYLNEYQRNDLNIFLNHFGSFYAAFAQINMGNALVELLIKTIPSVKPFQELSLQLNNFAPIERWVLSLTSTNSRVEAEMAYKLLSEESSLNLLTACCEKWLMYHPEILIRSLIHYGHKLPSQQRLDYLSKLQEKHSTLQNLPEKTILSQIQLSFSSLPKGADPAKLIELMNWAMRLNQSNPIDSPKNLFHKLFNQLPIEQAIVAAEDAGISKLLELYGYPDEFWSRLFNAQKIDITNFLFGYTKQALELNWDIKTDVLIQITDHLINHLSADRLPIFLELVNRYLRTTVIEPTDPVVTLIGKKAAFLVDTIAKGKFNIENPLAFLNLWEKLPTGCLSNQATSTLFKLAIPRNRNAEVVESSNRLFFRLFHLTSAGRVASLPLNSLTPDQQALWIQQLIIKRPVNEGLEAIRQWLSTQTTVDNERLFSWLKQLSDEGQTHPNYPSQFWNLLLSSNETAAVDFVSTYMKAALENRQLPDDKLLIRIVSYLLIEINHPKWSEFLGHLSTYVSSQQPITPKHPLILAVKQTTDQMVTKICEEKFSEYKTTAFLNFWEKIPAGCLSVTSNTLLFDFVIQNSTSLFFSLLKLSTNKRAPTLTFNQLSSPHQQLWIDHHLTQNSTKNAVKAIRLWLNVQLTVLNNSPIFTWIESLVKKDSLTEGLSLLQEIKRNHKKLKDICFEKGKGYLSSHCENDKRTVSERWNTFDKLRKSFPEFIDSSFQRQFVEKICSELLSSNPIDTNLAIALLESGLPTLDSLWSKIYEKIASSLTKEKQESLYQFLVIRLRRSPADELEKCLSLWVLMLEHLASHGSLLIFKGSNQEYNFYVTALKQCLNTPLKYQSLFESLAKFWKLLGKESSYSKNMVMNSEKIFSKLSPWRNLAIFEDTRRCLINSYLQFLLKAQREKSQPLIATLILEEWQLKNTHKLSRDSLVKYSSQCLLLPTSCQNKENLDTIVELITIAIENSLSFVERLDFLTFFREHLNAKQLEKFTAQLNKVFSTQSALPDPLKPETLTHLKELMIQWHKIIKEQKATPETANSLYNGLVFCTHALSEQLMDPSLHQSMLALHSAWLMRYESEKSISPAAIKKTIGLVLPHFNKIAFHPEVSQQELNPISLLAKLVASELSESKKNSCQTALNTFREIEEKISDQAIKSALRLELVEPFSKYAEFSSTVEEVKVWIRETFNPYFTKEMLWNKVHVNALFTYAFSVFLRLAETHDEHSVFIKSILDKVKKIEFRKSALNTCDDELERKEMLNQLGMLRLFFNPDQVANMPTPSVENALVRITSFISRVGSVSTLRRYFKILEYILQQKTEKHPFNFSELLEVPCGLWLKYVVNPGGKGLNQDLYNLFEKIQYIPPVKYLFRFLTLQNQHLQKFQEIHTDMMEKAILIWMNWAIKPEGVKLNSDFHELAVPSHLKQSHDVALSMESLENLVNFRVKSRMFVNSVIAKSDKLIQALEKDVGKENNVAKLFCFKERVKEFIIYLRGFDLHTEEDWKRLEEIYLKRWNLNGAILLR